MASSRSHRPSDLQRNDSYQHRRRLLHQDSGDLSDVSTSSNFAGLSPLSPFVPVSTRGAYGRIGEEDDFDDIAEFARGGTSDDGTGLGLHDSATAGPESSRTNHQRTSSHPERLFGGEFAGAQGATGPTTRPESGAPRPQPRRASTQSIPRVPVGRSVTGRTSTGSMQSPSKSPASPPETWTTPTTVHEEPEDDPPHPHRADGGVTRYPYGSVCEVEFDEKGGGDPRFKESISTLGGSYPPYAAADDAEARMPRSTSALKFGGPSPSVRSAFDSHFSPPDACPSDKPFYQGRANWIAVTILILSVYSTVFSGIYVAIALRGPRYGRAIRTDGTVSYSTASLLTALFAKTIELSFVTVFVAFLGQVLSRRAFMREQGRSITLAEMCLRTWVMQPGSLITHSESLRYAGWTILGGASLVATVVAMLYTTAADALVQPQLKFGDWQDRTMTGMVSSSFANAKYLAHQCRTPIPHGMDPEYGGSTCTQIQHAAQGYHNYQRYLETWTSYAAAGNRSSDLRYRPQGFALMYENTTVEAPWIEVTNMSASSDYWGRVVNNVSMAMPHPGVFTAARDERNGIIQPEELDGLGLYAIRASVPNPVVHVLCANMDREDLAPIVYEAWDESPAKLDVDGWPVKQLGFMDPKKYWNSTVVDDLFGWGPEHGQHAPVFAKYPIEYNTILNQTFAYGRFSIYLLARGLPAPAGREYLLCELKTSITPMCSTRYHASDTGGALTASCDDPPDPMAYIHTLPNATRGAFNLNADWPWIASEWGNALSLNAGINDADASNARLLSQLMLHEPTLNPALPSPAEALAVMAGSTLLDSALDTPFVTFYNYTDTMLPHAQPQTFRTLVRAQEYASGGVYGWQRAFHPILISVFLANVGVLAYLCSHTGLVTDFSEPPNLFALAINSPPAAALRGSCGAGPHTDQFAVGWVVAEEGGHLFVIGGEEAGVPERPTLGAQARWRGVRQRFRKRTAAERSARAAGTEMVRGDRISSAKSYTISREGTWTALSAEDAQRRQRQQRQQQRRQNEEVGESGGEVRSPISRMYSVFRKQTSVL